MRVGLYARVSTHDQQTLGLQLQAMRSYTRDRGWTLVTQVEDVGSGAKQGLRITIAMLGHMGSFVS